MAKEEALADQRSHNGTYCKTEQRDGIAMRDHFDHGSTCAGWLAGRGGGAHPISQATVRRKYSSRGTSRTRASRDAVIIINYG